MAKKRRRQKQKYQPRPVKDQAAPQAIDDPSLQSQQVDNVAPVADTPVAPVAPATGIPSTGMPISAVLGQQPPADNSAPEDQGYADGGPIEVTGHWGPKESSSSSSSEMSEELKNLVAMGQGGFGSTGTGRSMKRSASTGVQGWARGGSIPNPMPGYSDYPAMKTDPVARRRYSPRHVGFARGGEVDDPMDYVPDQPQEQPLQRGGYDEFNVIGRQDPKVNPMLADETGYAKGGPIAAAQVPAYTDPVYPAPSAANAKLYSDMAALRERTANPPALQMPAFNFPSAPAPGQQGPVPQRGTAVTPPVGPDDMPRLQRLGFAEGGAVPGGSDTEGYLNGDNAMDPQELDGVLQQIAQLDPNKGEDAVNLTAIVQAAQSGNMDQAASILAGFRRRFDSLNAHAQGAAAHGDMNTAAQLAGKAHSQVPDGMTVSYAVAPDGSGVTATVSPSGQTFQMNAQQFHDYLVGPGTSFDHILENGLEKNLAIASGRQGGQQASGANPAPIGYAQGGEVSDDDDNVEEAQRRLTYTGRQGEERTGPNTAVVAKKTKTAEPQPASDPYKVEPAEPYELPFSGLYSVTSPGSYWKNPAAERAERGQARQYAEELSSQRQLKDIELGRTPEQRDLQRATQERIDAEQAVKRHQDDGSRQSVKDVLDHTRRQYGLADDNPENAAPYQVAGDWMPPPAGGRTALEAGIGAPEQPVGGRTALSRGVGYEGPAGGQTAYQAAQARAPAPQTDERIPTGRGGFVARPAREGTEPAAAAEPRMGARPVPGPASARRGVEYPEPLPGEGLGGSTASARRVGVPAAAAAPEPQQLGSREDISLPPAAQPSAGVRPVLPANASPAEVNAAYKAAHAAAAERGDIYTTPRWSMDRLTKEAIPDIMQGKLFGRKNVVDYPELPAGYKIVGKETAPRPAPGPVDVEQRRAEAVQNRAQPQPSVQGAQPAAAEPHEQRMREIDAQQMQLRQPIAPAGSGVSEPKAYEGKRGVDRYNKEIVADQHRYNNEVSQRSATIADQHHQDDTIIRAYNNAKKDGTDTPELKRAYEASMYRMSGGKLAIPREEAPAAKQEQPGIMQRIFGTGASAQPAAQATYGSPGWPPRAPSPGRRWGQDASGRFVEY